MKNIKNWETFNENNDFNNFTDKEKEKYKIDKPFIVKVEWYDGSYTRETVIGETDTIYFFDVNDRGSYYAPKNMCKKI